MLEGGEDGSETVNSRARSGCVLEVVQICL